MSNVIILAIESSCDETAISVIKDSGEKLEILSNEISSQVKLHAKWGGVVPNLAAREHVKNITPLLELSLKNAGIEISDITAIAVTAGPGLIPALMIGTGYAKTLAYLWRKPLLAIHHIEGHIYANFVGEISNSEFPILCLVVSGGHTQLVLMKNHFQYEIIGQTLDDAVGEAFDKVARILSIGYPGGPAVAKQAENFQAAIPLTNDKGQAKTRNQNGSYRTQETKFQIKFPRPMMNKNNFNFSFSGLKTAVLYEAKKNPKLLKNKEYLAEICHEFQQACIDVLLSKTIKAAEQYGAKTIMLAGGVSANKQLREQLGQAIEKKMPGVFYRIPDFSLTGDNAAMIGAAAAMRWQKMSEAQKKKTLQNWKNLQPNANLKMK
jgi:N6-L-threonylcarbamoyladenine synthase